MAIHPGVDEQRGDLRSPECRDCFTKSMADYLLCHKRPGEIGFPPVPTPECGNHRALNDYAANAE